MLTQARANITRAQQQTGDILQHLDTAHQVLLAVGTLHWCKRKP